MRLRIKSFDFGDCGRSFLDIRDGQSSSSNLLKLPCSLNERVFSGLEEVFSSNRHLWVQYSAKRFSGGDKFYAVFEAVKQCKVEFSSLNCNQVLNLCSV